MATAFALRPLERTPANQTLNEGFRVHISTKELRNLSLASGDLIRLSTANGFLGFAVAWPANQTNPANKPIAKISDLLRDEYRLTLSDNIFIEKATDAWKPVESIHISCPDASSKYSSMEKLTHWVSNALEKLHIILPNGTFDVQQEGPRSKRNSKMRVTINKIDPVGDDSHCPYFDLDQSNIILRDNPWSNKEAVTEEESQPNVDIILQVDGEGIGGLSEQIDLINIRLCYLTFAGAETLDSHLNGPEAFLIHGSEGCGKTFLLDRLAECAWRSVLTLDDDWLAANRKGQSEAMSTEIFGKAREKQPSLILIDDLDKFLLKGDTLLRSLRKELRKLQGTQVVVAAAARSIYDIDASLRTSEGFQTELELAPPNVRQREDMLRQIIGPKQKITDVNFTSLAERSHGFVGRDMRKLCGLARRHCRDQIIRDLMAKTIPSSREYLDSLDFVTQKGFDAVFDQVQPTVLKDSILEVPKVKWNDIAGVDHIRTLLEDITVRPYKYPDLDVAFGGAQSRKGVLLYGPPGCAKTLIAQAVATESNLNFLAVKGSELIKMYVGESERAIRDIFRRARAAKPCIIFFDEIDSIGKSREKTQDSGLNVVTTLLNEMDGIEALKDVFIIGATNRPDILDSALIRTGRFDAHIHIGLPNQDARRQIVEIHTRKRPLAPDVDLSIIASRTEGSSGADIKGLCTTAVEMAKSDYVAAPGSEALIKMSHFDRALAQHIPHTIKEEAEMYEGWRPGKSLSAEP
ncbi:AAA-domain-containing protein [Massarina eburnea CBS 473.64]|uniref:AAA-domain-containing protein n=1 Tax=Massarina eburnea CBS 473.64 TaxID=1395130 RepID=A0A6A6SDH4_9PLEO|nr:AAA-domain-containing protein [Massarina eburnea CBS 473.64]